MSETTHIRVYGRVQGVFYRQWTMSEARARGLTGWVRNRVDGTVEAMFVGDEKDVADMINACRQGSPRAFVTKVEFQLTPDATMPEIINGEFYQAGTI
ncbi:MAG: acylphosphatase [Alphaproteobacteria bacterium]|nr:acylphosphatase [Alphaproteobacteria bacterium]